MIYLTRLNRTPIVLNADLIEHIELAPDTVICLTSGEKIRVQESADEVIARVLDWRKKIRQSIKTEEPCEEWQIRSNREIS